jgi:nucleoside phosphorylase
MKETWATAIDEVLAQCQDSLGALDRSRVLDNLSIWLGHSKTNPEVMQISGVLRELLQAHGATVMPDSGFRGPFDESLVQEQVKKADLIAMLAITPGVSAEALELCNIDKSGADKMHVYMPDEYRGGYIHGLLDRKHKARISPFALDRLRSRREPELCRTIFCDALTAALDKQRKKLVAPHPRPSIGIVTALPKELLAVRDILQNPTFPTFRDGDDYREYLHGTLPAKDGGEHQIVLALGGMGNNNAAISATNLLRDFGSVEDIFVVGIAAGVPCPTKPADHVRLGDVVIANGMGVVQYDMVKQSTKSVKYVSAPRPPSAEWLRVADRMLASMPASPPFWDYLDKLLSGRNLARPKKDQLNDTPWVKRGARVSHPRDPARKKDRPRIHQGPIGSGNKVLKSAKVRNDISGKFGLRAIEMEGSGIADAAWAHGKSFMIVRGICDYANDTKMDDWQDYAACAAADGCGSYRGSSATGRALRAHCQRTGPTRSAGHDSGRRRNRYR